MPAEGTQRRRVRYTGRVQGVGFRFTAQRIAQGYAVTGYVKNLPDRSVELVAEGMPEELDRFFTEIAETMAGNIRQADVQTLSATGEFGEFGIAY
jgi:acylphosphatase